jgi:hypothetical protein
VHAEHVGTVIHELSARLGRRAEVRPAGKLCERIGSRLKPGFGDVAVGRSRARSSGQCRAPETHRASRARPADAKLDVNAVPQVPSSHMTGHRTLSSAALQAAAVTQVDGADPETTDA